MPRYFFHIHDGLNSRDERGTELPDWRAAQVEAVRLAGAILNEDAQRLAIGEDWCMQVTDETGLLLFRLDFFVTQSAVLRAERLRDEERSSRLHYVGTSDR